MKDEPFGQKEYLKTMRSNEAKTNFSLRTNMLAFDSQEDLVRYFQSVMTIRERLNLIKYGCNYKTMHYASLPMQVEICLTSEATGIVCCLFLLWLVFQ